MKAATKIVQAGEVRVGMDVEFLGRFHRIVRIDTYEGPFTELGAFAIVRWVGSRGHEQGMTLFKGSRVEVAAGEDGSISVETLAVTALLAPTLLAVVVFTARMFGALAGAV